MLFCINGTCRSNADAILFKDIFKDWASKITVSGSLFLWRQRKVCEPLFGPFCRSYVGCLGKNLYGSLPCGSALQNSTNISMSSSKVTKASSSPSLCPVTQSWECISTWLYFLILYWVKTLCKKYSSTGMWNDTHSTCFAEALVLLQD